MSKIRIASFVVGIACIAMTGAQIKGNQNTSVKGNYNIVTVRNISYKVYKVSPKPGKKQPSYVISGNDVAYLIQAPDFEYAERALRESFDPSLSRKAMVATLPVGTRVKVFGEAPDPKMGQMLTWYRVRVLEGLAKGKTGFISKSRVEVKGNV